MCKDGMICEKCGPTEIVRRLDVHIAQNQRILDLLEREAGYDNIPLILTFPFGGAALAINTDYQLPAFDAGAVLQGLLVCTDATAINLDVLLYHSSIVTNSGLARTPLFRFTGSTNNYSMPAGKVTIPARGVIGARFNALTGGTFLTLSASYSRSEQTSIEYHRSQRAGRIA